MNTADQSFFSFLSDNVSDTSEPQSRGIVWIDELRDYPAEMVSARAKSNGTRWCHMWANDPDSVEELHRIACVCGLKLAFFQDRPGFPHYDLVPSKRALALAAGAREKSLRDWLNERRSNGETSLGRKPQELRRPAEPRLRVVPGTVVWRRSVKEAACLPNRAHSKINRPAPDVNAPKFEPLNPPRCVRADRRTYRLAISRPRALAAVRQA